MDLKNKNIVVLTGAGISAESGIKTFRDNDGLWENHRVEDVATPEAFAQNPKLVQDFYNQRRAQLRSGEIKPNAAHITLAKFEAQHDADFCLVTQNVDNLHQLAGSNNIYAMHGELNKARCIHCEAIMDAPDSLGAQSQCKQCGSIGSLRPHVVWFGEMPLHMQAIEERLARCDVFVSIGTSSQVYPAAGFSQTAKFNGAICVELNMEPSATADIFDYTAYGAASIVVPEFFR